MTKEKSPEFTSNSILIGEKVHHPIDVSINKIFEDSIEENIELKK